MCRRGRAGRRETGRRVATRRCCIVRIALGCGLVAVAGGLTGCALPGPISVMSLNLGPAETGAAGGCAASGGGADALIRARAPEVVGVQGAGPERAGELRAALAGYACIGETPAASAGESGGLLICYDPSRFAAVEWGRVRLTGAGTAGGDDEQPGGGGRAAGCGDGAAGGDAGAAGSGRWRAARVGVAMWARLRLKGGWPVELHVVNVHLERSGRSAQAEAARALRRLVAGLGDGAAVVLGDFAWSAGVGGDGVLGGLAMDEGGLGDVRACAGGAELSCACRGGADKVAGGRGASILVNGRLEPVGDLSGAEAGGSRAVGSGQAVVARLRWRAARAGFT